MNTTTRVQSPTADAAYAHALDLGCGREKLPGALGMDKNPRSDADRGGFFEDRGIAFFSNCGAGRNALEGEGGRNISAERMGEGSTL